LFGYNLRELNDAEAEARARVGGRHTSPWRG
jgi:hypothetical protein